MKRTPQTLVVMTLMAAATLHAGSGLIKAASGGDNAAITEKLNAGEKINETDGNEFRDKRVQSNACSRTHA